MIVSWFLLQIQNNWTYGEVLDENAKTHPMLRPYKTFSEKVIVHLLVNLSVNMLLFSLFAVANVLFTIYIFLWKHSVICLKVHILDFV